MVLAIAALALHIGNAVPAAAVASAKLTADSARTGAIVNLPDAPTASPNAASASAEPAPKALSANQKQQSAPAELRLAALDSSGNDTQTLSTIRVPEVHPEKRKATIGVESIPSRKTWLMLATVEHGAATFDAYTTRRALATGAHEDNPVMRPFAGSPGIYAAIQVCPFVLDYAAARMQRSQNSLLRHTWWLPQTVGTGVSLISGVHNLSIANRR